MVLEAISELQDTILSLVGEIGKLDERIERIELLLEEMGTILRDARITRGTLLEKD